MPKSAPHLISSPAQSIPWVVRCRQLISRCDLNLAPFRYEKVLHKDGGPIDHLEQAEHSVKEGVMVNVNAFLDRALRPSSKKLQFFSDSDGGGTHPNGLVARFMAISEALERWAFWDRSGSNMRDLYGFDIDSSTTGMAAFPGLFQARAQRRAKMEAVERFGLLHWWEGRLGHREHDLGDGVTRALEILVPMLDTKAVVVYEDDPVSGTRHYGYGAGDSLPAAFARATREMIRHRVIVGRYLARFPDPLMGLATIAHSQERRALFFALPEGRNLFDERRRETPWARPAQEKTVFDGWVPGPWDRFATVWRCLYEPPSDEYLSDRTDYFFW